MANWLNFIFLVPAIISVASISAADQTYKLSDRPIFSAIYQGSKDKVESLLKAGSDSNEDFHGTTPLF